MFWQSEFKTSVLKVTMKKDKKNQGKSGKMSRKDAVKKIGFTAFTGATMMFLLNNPAKADGEDSPALPPPW